MDKIVGIRKGEQGLKFRVSYKLLESGEQLEEEFVEGALLKEQ